MYLSNVIKLFVIFLNLGGGKDLATAANIKTTFIDEKPPTTSVNTNLHKPLESTPKLNPNNIGNDKQ